MEVGLVCIILVQFIMVALLGFFMFPSGKEFLGFLKGDFLYKDYLGLVTGNCFIFGVLTFGLSYFLNRREYTNQKVIYREVLRNEVSLKSRRVQRKFLSPHVVYFSGLDQRIKKSDFEEELTEYVDYGRENDSLSSENGSLILEEERVRERDEKYGNFTSGFKRGKDPTGRVHDSEINESVDRMFFISNNQNTLSVKENKNTDGKEILTVSKSEKRESATCSCKSNFKKQISRF